MQQPVKKKGIRQLIKDALNKYIFSYIKTWYLYLKDKWETYVTPILDKIFHFLTHNFIYYYDDKEIRIFSFIKFKNTRNRREIIFGFLFISLWLIGFIVFTLYPLIHSFYLSFTESYFNADIGIYSTPIGFSNFLNIIQSQTLSPLYAAYIGKMLLAVPLIVIFSLVISMLINQPIKGKGMWRTIFFLPVIIATGPVISDLASQGAISLPSLEDSSFLQFVTDNLGSFMADPIINLLDSLLLVLWYAGIPILIFIAALQKIDKSVYEASSIDGASPWDNFWKITLPSIKPFITINIVYIVVSMSLFVEEGGILDLTKLHMLNGNSTSKDFHGYGYASAMAWIYLILMILIMGLFIGLISIRGKGSKSWKNR